MEASRLKKTAVSFGKILISLVLIWLVFRKLPFNDVAKLWKSVNPLFLFLGAVLFLISQIISAKRLQLYFKMNDFPLGFSSNLKLYFLGMFYNFFIPGGIGGDAYKIYLLNKKFGWNAKQLTSSLFNDRLSGLTAICLIICFLGAISMPEFSIWFSILFVAGIVLSVLLIKKLFPKFQNIHWRGLLLSLTVQISQIICFYFLLKSIGVKDNFAVYALLFLSSSVLSLISFAGIGVREMLFLLASKYFDFSAQYSVSASLLFTFITAFFSFFGLYFQLRKVNLELQNPPVQK